MKTAAGNQNFAPSSFRFAVDSEHTRWKAFSEIVYTELHLEFDMFVVSSSHKISKAP